MSDKTWSRVTRELFEVSQRAVDKAKTELDCAQLKYDAAVHFMREFEATIAIYEQNSGTPFGSHDCPACGRSTSHVCAR